MLSARLEPGPWTFRGEVVESGAAMTIDPEARPEVMGGVWDAQVRARLSADRSLAGERAPQKVDLAGGPIGAVGGVLADDDP